MSDPAKKGDDEDVLTSIRRLVSAGKPPEAAPVSPTTDKLVLSEAHRVDAGTGDDPWTDTLENRIAELEAAVTAQKGEFEPDGSELLDRETPRTIDHLAAAKRMVAQFRDTADGPPTAGANTSAAEALKLTPDLAPASNTDDAPSVTRETVQDEVSTPQPEPDAVEPQEPTAGAAAQPELSPEPTVAVTPPEPESAPAAIDEDALRKLISEILREEFQGDLGERVTRSIRKLVRQEIKRALATHDLD